MTKHHETSVSASTEWYTPKWIFEDLGVEFDLDPCAPKNRVSHVPAKKVFTKDDDGLAQDWGDDFVFCNPPFGRGAIDWLNKAIQNNNGLFLVTARTETRLFQKALRHASGAFFFDKRVAFHNGDPYAIPDRGNTVGNVIFAFGELAKQVLLYSKLSGTHIETVKVVRR